MKSIKMLLILITGLSISELTHAQTINLTLKEALKYAIENNQNAKKSRLDIEGGKQKTNEVRASALPQLNANASLAYNPIIGQLVTDMGSFKMGRPWNSAAAVQLDQQLFNQQVFTGLQAAKASENYYALNAELTEEQVIEQTANNYYQVLVNREQLSVVDTNIKNIKVIEKIITDQYNNGLAKKIDVDRIKVNLTNLETQRQQIVNAIEQLEIQLKLAMGMPISTSIVLPSSELRDINTLPLLENEIAVNNRTELKLLDVQRSLLNLQRKAYVSEYYPSLALSANYSYTTMTNKFDPFQQKSTAQGSVGYDASAIGLSLRVPIFSGFRTRSKVKQAEIDILKAEEDTKATTNALNAAYENAKIQLKNSFNTIQSQRSNVRLAQEIYESTQNNYNNGLASLTDLLDTENSLTQAQNSYNQALLNYKVAEIQLSKSKGELKSLINEQ